MIEEFCVPSNILMLLFKSWAIMFFLVKKEENIETFRKPLGTLEGSWRVREALRSREGSTRPKRTGSFLMAICALLGESRN